MDGIHDLDHTDAINAMNESDDSSDRDHGPRKSEDDRGEADKRDADRML